MLDGVLTTVPADPPGIAEWEELLVRVDLAPRALRAAVEDTAPGSAVLNELLRVLGDELRWERALRAIQQGETVPTDLVFPDPPSESASGDDVEQLLRAVAGLRSRNSAQVQRRGIDVWRWRAPTDGGGFLSVYQLLVLMVRSDAGHLAALRRLTGALVR